MLHKQAKALSIAAHFNENHRLIITCAGLDCGLAWTPALSVMHSSDEAACMAKQVLNVCFKRSKNHNDKSHLWCCGGWSMRRSWRVTWRAVHHTKV